MPETIARRKTKSRSLFILAGVIFVGFCVVNLKLILDLEKSQVGVGIIGSSGNDNNVVPKSPFSGNTDTIININLASIQDNSTDNSSNNNNNNDLVLEYFREAVGVELDDESIERLPTWSQIESLIGDKPVLLGLERCNDFRNDVPPLRRMLGSSGMFNSGTNLVTRLMKENCVIPERYEKYGPRGTKAEYGIRRQCPWGKHTPVNEKYNHTTPKNEDINKDDCLPVVTIRNPYDWMQSMCRHPYTAKWSMHERRVRGNICPHLVYTDSKKDKLLPVELKAKLAEQWMEFGSLAHLWNEWYAQYWRYANFPYLIVRFEDLIFRQYDTTKIICDCAGGAVNSKSAFKYIVDSAKQGPGHGKKEERTGMIDAWIKYGKPKEVKAGFSDLDWEASLEFLSRELMGKMGYRYPPSE